MPRKKKEENSEIDLDFPVFTVDSNDYLNEAVESAMEIQEEMKEILNELDDINNKLENAGLQLNLYINNVLKMKKPFDFTKHIIIFDDNNDLYFYDHKIVEKHIVTSEDIDIDHSKILELLPKQEGYKLAPKQFKKALDMINEYNKLALQYECNLVEFETDGEEYEEIMDAVRKELSSIKLIDISKGDYNGQIEIEPFNKNKHELIITQNSKSKKWNFVYIRKEDKQKLIDYMKKME